MAATLIFNVLRYRIAQRYVSIPLPDMLVVQVAALAVLTALLGRYAADFNVGLRVVITAVVSLLLARLTLRHGADASLGSLT